MLGKYCKSIEDYHFGEWPAQVLMFKAFVKIQHAFKDSAKERAFIEHGLGAIMLYARLVAVQDCVFDFRRRVQNGNDSDSVAIVATEVGVRKEADGEHDRAQNGAAYVQGMRQVQSIEGLPPTPRQQAEGDELYFMFKRRTLGARL